MELTTTGQMITIALPDGDVEAYLASPAEGRHPGVLFFTDAIGLRPRTKEMADRIASWGYTVLVPHMFFRNGSAADLEPKTDLRVPGNREEFMTTALPRARAFAPETLVADAEHYLRALKASEKTTEGRVAITGYCMGGAFAVRVASAYPDQVCAVGSFHAGDLVNEKENSPHRLVKDARAEFFVAHADNDKSMSPEAQDEWQRTLDALNIRHTSQLFVGSPHGFTMADASPYHHEGAERHFTELHALLDRTFARP